MKKVKDVLENIFVGIALTVMTVSIVVCVAIYYLIRLALVPLIVFVTVFLRDDRPLLRRVFEEVKGWLETTSVD
jgi:ABC-type bacteriocin/lantibiotic exporter with double-glycine peptidase domain